MNERLEALRASSVAGRDVWRPEIFRMTDAEDRSRLDALLASGEVLVVNDTLHSQLKELIRALDPASKFTPASLDEAAKAHLGTVPADHYGVWVFYPWSRCLVHLIEEAEFILVRTDRNRNKITRAEQERLMELKVGVIGLSVGQSVCLTMALERTFGEMRIADFDTLDLSNLNRIRSGLHLLGQRKAVNVAREIAEIDPFLKVTVFTDGITEANLDAFLLEGGKLDVLVDECDSVGIKIRSRIRAKELGIPVVMDTSDRGLIDIERFDLEPDRPIMHGLIAHLDPAKAMEAKTQEDKLPFVIPMTGLDTLSKRMKASMLEIDKTVTTWPQLATSVVLGGAVTGDVIRRMALGQLTRSGRWFVDVEEMIADERVAVVSSDEMQGTEDLFHPQPLLAETMDEAAHQLPPLGEDRLELSEYLSKQLAEAGALAPSAGNDQPWRFHLAGGRLLLFHDPSRSYSRIDPDHLIARISLGTCIENILLKSRSMGLALEHAVTPLPHEPCLIAAFEGRRAIPKDPALRPDPLSERIAERCTNRKKGDHQPISPDHLLALRFAATGAIPGTDVHFVTGRSALDEMASVCGAAERMRILNAICHRELFTRELRWTTEEAERTRDGLDLATFELTLSERTGMSVAADPHAIGHLRNWQGGRGFEKLSGDGIRSSSAIALVSVPTLSVRDQLAGGRAAQRVWLKAAELRLSAHPISAPIFLGVFQQQHREGVFGKEERTEIEALYRRTMAAFKITDRQPLFMMRLAYAGQPSVRSLRRPLADMFTVGNLIKA
jgi:molybdopterin/thiamine biosynthesis adenylyltransferase/nitroreductase